MNNIVICFRSYLYTLSDRRQEQEKKNKNDFGRALTNTLLNKPDK